MERIVATYDPNIVNPALIRAVVGYLEQTIETTDIRTEPVVVDMPNLETIPATILIDPLTGDTVCSYVVNGEGISFRFKLPSFLGIPEVTAIERVKHRGTENEEVTQNWKVMSQEHFCPDCQLLYGPRDDCPECGKTSTEVELDE